MATEKPPVTACRQSFLMTIALDGCMTRTEYLALRMQAWTSFAAAAAAAVDIPPDGADQCAARCTRFANSMIERWEAAFKIEVAKRFGLTARGVRALEDNVQFFRILDGSAE